MPQTIKTAYTLQPHLVTRTMRRQCSWCQTYTDGLGGRKTGERVTHGLCDPCDDRLRDEHGIPRRDHD
jgi:hypothetical protein